MTDFLLASGETVSAAAAYQMLVAACAKAPEDPEAWYRLGCLLNDLKSKPLAAAAAFRRSCNLREKAGLPACFKTLTNLGWNLHLGGRSEEAFEPLGTAVNLNPEAAHAWANLAQVYGLVGQQELAILSGRRAVQFSGGADPLHHMALAFQLFFAKQWEEGFREYENRFAFRMQDALSFPYPLWRGEKLGKRVVSNFLNDDGSPAREHHSGVLYLVGEQGLGDSVWGLRWLPELTERVCRGDLAKVIFHVHRELLSLVREHLKKEILWGLFEVEGIPHALPEADAWCALLSLPVALGLKQEELADGEDQGAAYLESGVVAHEWRVQAWDQNGPVPLDPPVLPPGPRRIGIVWSGALNGDDAAIKTVPFADILRLVEVPGVEVHSLQLGPAAAAIADYGAHALVLDRSPEISNMADTARLIAGLDLIVSADTAAAHLAGALGKPVWLLLNARGGDGRWGRGSWGNETGRGDGDRTNWYASMRVWRRGISEQWSDVLRRVCEALR